jgi:hypothetical protein
MRSATNYVISANGMHGHPTDITLAGIMASRLIHYYGQNVVGIPRIILTDGYSAYLDQVSDLVTKLIQNLGRPNGNPPARANWRNFVQIHALYEDVLMAVTTTGGNILRTIELSFNNAAQQDQLRYLRDNLNASMPHEIPRGRASNDQAFRMYIVTARVVTHELRVSQNGNLRVDAVANPPQQPAHTIRLTIDNQPQAVGQEEIFKYAVDEHGQNGQIRMLNPVTLALKYSKATAGLRSECTAYNEVGDPLKVINGQIAFGGNAYVQVNNMQIQVEPAVVRFVKV